ncbi:hypothetical protein [Streptococcus sp. KHUD_014]|uniref:hypothetical protein n=1 Tax=Streptococcus sp. KHUD_014 TaxID=3434353 RepID=UPI003DA53D2F
MVPQTFNLSVNYIKYLSFVSKKYSELYNKEYELDGYGIYQVFDSKLSKEVSYRSCGIWSADDFNHYVFLSNKGMMEILINVSLTFKLKKTPTEVQKISGLPLKISEVENIKSGLYYLEASLTNDGELYFKISDKLIKCEDFVALRLIDEGLDLRSIESEYELDIATIHPENHFVYQVLNGGFMGLAQSIFSSYKIINTLNYNAYLLVYECDAQD